MEIVCVDPTSAEPLAAVLPDGTKVTIPPDTDPRQVFADWLITPENPWFARSIVNRIWAWFLGRGIIHEPNDIWPDNPAVGPDASWREARADLGKAAAARSTARAAGDGGRGHARPV